MPSVAMTTSPARACTCMSMSCACARTLACRRGFSSSVCQQDKHSGTCATPVPRPLLPPPPLPFNQGPNRAQSIFVCMHTHLCLACTFVGTHACSAVYTCIHTPLTLVSGTPTSTQDPPGPRRAHQGILSREKSEHKKYLRSTRSRTAPAKAWCISSTQSCE